MVYFFFRCCYCQCLICDRWRATIEQLNKTQRRKRFPYITSFNAKWRKNKMSLMIAVYKIFFFLINEVVVIIFKRFKFIRKILNRNELLWRRLVEITTAQFPFLWRPLENGATLEGSKNTTTNQQLVCVCVFVSLVLCVRCMTVSVVRLFFFFVFLFHVKSYVLYRFFLFVVMISFWFYIYMLCDDLCVCKKGGMNWWWWLPFSPEQNEELSVFCHFVVGG